MPSGTQKSSRFTRRILLLGAALLVFALGYTAAWFATARALENEVTATIKGMNGNGIRAYCEEPEAEGYPFRIGLFCRSVFYEDVNKGISVRAGAMRSAAHVYRPSRVVGEVDSPAAIVLPLLVPMEIRWKDLRASARLAGPLPERVSVEGQQIVISAQEGDTTPLATLAAMEAHARQQGNAVETAISFRGFQIGAQIAPDFAPLDGRALVLVEGGVTMAAEGRLDPYGQSAKIREFVVGVAGQNAEISLSGPISIDEDGRIDAQLRIGFSNPRTVMEYLAQVFPDAREEIMTAASALSSLGDTPVVLNIRKGRVFLGFIPIGTIPPV